MSGRKIWSILVLIALVGVLQAVTPTNIAQTTNIASPQTINLSTGDNYPLVVFTADYNFTDPSSGLSMLVPNGNMILYVDEVPYPATFSLSTPPTGMMHYYAIANLTPGTHTWYFTGGSSSNILGGFASATSPAQKFVVNQVPTTITQTTNIASPQTVNPPAKSVTVVFTADYNFTDPPSGLSMLVPGNLVLYVDEVPYPATFSLSTPPTGMMHYYAIANLTPGTHTWYFTGGSDWGRQGGASWIHLFQPATSPTKTFVVNPLPGNRSYYTTTITQKAVPASPQVVDPILKFAQVIFTADYNFTYNGYNMRVLNANVILYVDGVPYPAQLIGGGAPYLSYAQVANLSAGTHTWYFRAGASNIAPPTGTDFLPVTSPTQTFVVSQIPTTITQKAVPASPQVVDPVLKFAQVIFTADYNFTYNGYNLQIPYGNVILYVDGVPYPAQLIVVGAPYLSYARVANLSAGTHTWYFRAGVPTGISNDPIPLSYPVIFQPATSPTQTDVVNCPAPYCSGNQRCSYSGSSCTLTCVACPSGTTCSGGTVCLSPGSGGGSPLFAKMEPTQQMPVGDTWTIAVVIVAILGLCIGYFILKEALFTSVTKTTKRKK